MDIGPEDAPGDGLPRGLDLRRVRRGGRGEIQEALFDHLEAPVLRVGARNAHIPFAPVLERAVVPARRGDRRAARTVMVAGHAPRGELTDGGRREASGDRAEPRPGRVGHRHQLDAGGGRPGQGKGETIATIETEKSEVEIESPAEGVLEIAVAAGPELVSADATLGFVDDGAP